MIMQYFNSIMLDLVSWVVVVLTLLVGVAFLTLMERKVLGYVQDRKGPNKVGFKGILQPFSEAIKLLSKEVMVVFKSSYFIFYFSPVFSMFLLFIIWVSYPFFTNVYFLNYSILIIILILSLNSYMIMMMGWSSGSLYSMVGAVRSIAQLLSYEVSFMLIIFVPLVLSESYSFMDFIKWQIYSWYIWMMLPLVVVFIISILAELNRSPMDFVEGESELVSGFNVEYFSGPFVLIFLAEYGMIIFMSFLLMYMYMASASKFIMVLMLGLTISLVILMRGILPRMRYDELMYLCWKIILPLVLNYLIFFLMGKMYLNLIM